MKIALIEVGHWHASMYVERLKSCGATVVAVSDRDEAVVSKVSQALGCRAYTDYSKLVSQQRPDFVFAFGIHSEMPDIVRLLIENEVPFAIEKPAGIDHRRIEELADLAERKGLFNAVPFVFRLHPMVQVLQSLRQQGKIGDFTHVCLRYIAGPPDRYRAWGCEWMLQREKSGGGCTMNLGIHFIDLFSYMTGSRIRRVYGRMSTLLHGEEVEDCSTIVLDSEDGTIGVVETAYAHPTTQQYYAFITTEGYAVVHGDIMEYVSKKGEREQIKIEQRNLYADFVDHTLDRFNRDERPLATLHDVSAALRVVGLSYRSNHHRRPYEVAVGT